jgi:hapalindole biogenesis HpiC1 cyclase-like protein
MRSAIRLLTLFLFALPFVGSPLALFAQTPVAIQNANFAASPSVPSVGEGGVWGYSPITDWVTSGPIGLWQPDTTGCGFASQAGNTLAWMNSGSTLSQDLGVGAASGLTYTLTVPIGLRGCFYPVNYTISLSVGTTPLCSQSGSNGTLTVGTLTPQTVTCQMPTPAPSGDLIVSISVPGNQNGQLEVGTITLTSAGAYVFVLPTCGASTCTFTFPIANASSLPACGSADGTCSLMLQTVAPAASCSTTGTITTCTLSTTGAINIVKNSSTNGQTVTPLVTATSP